MYICIDIFILLGTPHVYIYISIYLGKFHHDLTVLPSPGIMVNRGNHPKMAAIFRLVKYCNFP